MGQRSQRIQLSRYQICMTNSKLGTWFSECALKRDTYPGAMIGTGHPSPNMAQSKSLIFPLKLGIFNSYVKLPEGIYIIYIYNLYT